VSRLSGSIFVYGTLCFDKVLQALLQRIPTKTPHTLSGYYAKAIVVHDWNPFPVLLEDDQRQVRGYLLKGLTAVELQIIDRFETAAYIVGSGYFDRKPLFEHLDETVEYYRPSAKLFCDGTLGADWDMETYQAAFADSYVADTIPAFFGNNPDLEALLSH
jgi:gamma-glutamylcyclotransferase (GGCT)/AIG2-like uncharacterized protein YtfP